jgi:type I restriction enzyme S subunit
MRSGWIETTLGDVARVNSGFAFSTKSWRNTGIPVIKINNVRNGQVSLVNCSFVSDPLPEGASRFLLKKGDLLITLTGEIGAVGFVTQSQPMYLNQRVGRIDLRDNKNVLLDFLGLFLTLPEVRAEMWSHGKGNAQLNISPTSIHSLKINLPPITEQKRIVDLISSVDFYIESLQRQLESAKKSRNAVLHELLTAGGDDWVETTLGDVAHLNPEQARDYDSDRLIKYIDLSTVAFDTGISSEIDQLPFNEAPGRARRIIRENDVIVSTVRPYLKGFAFVGKEFNGQIASTGFCVIRAKSESILSELIWALVGSDDFVDFLIRRSTGSNYPAVRPNDISDFTFMLPPLHDQETVSKLITTFDDTIRASSVLINSAQNLRSGLLSDLLSGVHEIPESYDKVMGAS